MRALVVLGALALALTGCAGQVASDEDLSLAAAQRGTFLSAESTSVPRALTRRATRARAADVVDRFDAGRALRDARAITSFGVRPGGSEAESSAAGYVVAELRRAGLRPRVDKFKLPNEKTSRNVTVVIPGTDSKREIIVGAHLDTKPPSPGANDNASGCGVTLELARQLRSYPASADVKVIFFGAEEFLADAPGDNHHLGSRFSAAKMSASQVRNTAGMLSVDMVGYGEQPYVRNMKRAPQDFANALQSEAGRQGVDLRFRKDPGRTGWSDHEPYERRGIPSAWLEWLEDPVYHTADDDSGHIKRGPIELSGKLILGTLHSLGPEELEELCKR